MSDTHVWNAASNGVPTPPSAPRRIRAIRPHEHEHLALFLENFLAEHQCTGNELSRRCNMSDGFINQIKNPRNVREGKAPARGSVLRLARALGLPTETLLGPSALPNSEQLLAQPQEHAASIPRGNVEDIAASLQGIREALESLVTYAQEQLGNPLLQCYRLWPQLDTAKREQFLAEVLTSGDQAFVIGLRGAEVPWR